MSDPQHLVLNDIEVAEALKIAGELIDAGIPIFSAAPNPERPGEYYLPKDWQHTVPSHVWLDRWQPGHALAAVGGIRESGGADFLDEDPRNGGSPSIQELRLQGHMPRYFGLAETPSGGRHYLISATGERKSTGFMPGLDLQSGDASGAGRGFVWISPTVRPSKAPETLGQLHPYRWVERPDTALLEDFRGTDDTGQGIIARIYARRTSSVPTSSASPADPFVSASQLGTHAQRSFTRTQAQDFCRGHLVALAEAQIGQIEERCNAAAAQLSHFVPAFWSADEAMELLRRQLAMTAYDPTHPASSWEVEKFRPVLDGTRPTLDPWRAQLMAKHAELAAPAIPSQEERGELSRADWLESQLLTADEIASRPAPVPLVYGMLDMNSEAWIIGAPGSYKSFVALDLAAHVGAGREWHGHRVRRERVLYLAAEGANGMTLRTRAWQKIHGPMTGVDFLPLPIQVSKMEDWAALVQVADRRAYGMVIIDTQARVTKGLDENAARDMGVYVDAVTALRQATSACVLTVHHTGRKGGDARGSSALDGAQDSELKLERIMPRESMKVRLRDDKQKDMAEDAEGVELLLRVVDLGIDPETGRPLSSLVINTDPYAAAQAEGAASVDGGQVETIREPGPWTWALFDNIRSDTKRRILQVLLDAGGQAGLTEARTQKLVAEKWHDGKVGRGAGQLQARNFSAAWSELVTHVLPSGELLLVNPSSTKRAVNPEVLKTDE